MSKSYVFRATVAAALVFSAGLASASGTDGAASGETGNAAAYNTGKAVYANKLACSTCPLAGQGVSAEIARNLLKNQPDAKLSADESAALAVYLKRRFKL